MNTTGLCNRFEREGLMQLERGLPLDGHYASCESCEQAQQKYATIFAALPKSAPDVAPELGWQSRVLKNAMEREETRPLFSSVRLRTSDAWAAMAMAGALTAAALGFGPRALQFDVQADTQVTASPALPEMALPAPIPTEPDTLPAPAPVAPKTLPKQVHSAPAPVPVKNAEPTAPAPRAEPEAPSITSRATAPTEPKVERSNRPRVVRPDKLYGFSLNYPKAAMAARVQGEVSVQCTVRADGRNTNCRILKSLPFLDESILRALAAARTDPIKVDGKPVDNSDHIWHITITLREAKEEQTLGRGIPVINWKW